MPIMIVKIGLQNYKVHCQGLLQFVVVAGGIYFPQISLILTAEWYFTIKHNREQKDLHKIKGFTM